eukprot:828-Heterococcus_DN1.PRE.3
MSSGRASTARTLLYVVAVAAATAAAAAAVAQLYSPNCSNFTASDCKRRRQSGLERRGGDRAEGNGQAMVKQIRIFVHSSTHTNISAAVLAVSSHNKHSYRDEQQQTAGVHVCHNNKEQQEQTLVCYLRSQLPSCKHTAVLCMAKSSQHSLQCALNANTVRHAELQQDAAL